MKPVDPDDEVRETPAFLRGLQLAVHPNPGPPWPPCAVAQDSKWAKTGRNLQMQIMKKDKEEEEHWPRITKDKVKLSWLQTDWSRYVDEDEEDEKPADMGESLLHLYALCPANFGA